MSISRFILPFILVILSGLMYVIYIDPTYKDILELRSKKVDFTDAISKASEVRDLQAKLLAEVEAIDPSDRARIEKMLPPSYDPVLILYDLNMFAHNRGLALKTPTVRLPVPEVSGGAPQPELTSMSVQFSVAAPYSIFRKFVADLERELSLRDIKTLSITGSGSGDGGGALESSVFTYQMEIEGYAYHEKEKKAARPNTPPAPSEESQ